MSNQDAAQTIADGGSTTRFHSLHRRQALLVVALLTAAIAGGLAISRGPAPKTGGTGEGDVALFSKVVDLVRAGQGYYDAMGPQLSRRGYPTKSVFNWRPPLLLELIAHLPSAEWARALLIALALGTIVLAVAALARDHLYGLALLQFLLLCLPLSITAMSAGYLFAEVWSGVLIAMSVGWYALGWPRAGASAGLAALFFRELALPFALIGVFLAYRQKRRTELALWLVGLAAYAVYLGLHARAVISHIPPSATAPGLGRWIQFGGWRFLLITSRVGLLLGFPFRAACFYLPLALLGLAGWSRPVSVRAMATVAAYLLAFSVVGVPSQNFYWGAMYSPLLAFGATWALPACRDLLESLRGGPPDWDKEIA